MSASSTLREVADWLVETGYPFDWTCTILPPEALRREVEEAWVRRDGPTDADYIRGGVAAEGGWE